MEQEFRVDFIPGRRELEMFVRFAMEGSMLQDVELVWRDEERAVSCRCLEKTAK
jgi:hypothetical protein